MSAEGALYTSLGQRPRERSQQASNQGLKARPITGFETTPPEHQPSKNLFASALSY